MTSTPINDQVTYLDETTNVPSNIQNTSSAANKSSANPTAMASSSNPSTSTPFANPTITVTPVANTSSKRAPAPNSNPYCPTSSSANPRGPSQASTSGIPYAATPYGVLASDVVSAGPDTYYGASSPISIGPVSGYNKAAAEANGMRTDLGGLKLADKVSVEALYHGQGGFEGQGGGGYGGGGYGGQRGPGGLAGIDGQQRLIHAADNGSPANGYAAAQENLRLEGELRRDGLGDAFNHTGHLDAYYANANANANGNGASSHLSPFAASNANGLANAFGSKLNGSLRHPDKTINTTAANGYNNVTNNANRGSHHANGANINSPLFDLPPRPDDEPARYPIVQLEDKDEDEPKRGTFRYVCDKSSRYALNLAAWMNDTVLHLPLVRSCTQGNFQDVGGGVEGNQENIHNTQANAGAGAEVAAGAAAHPKISFSSPGAVHNPLELVSTGTDSDFRSTIVGSETAGPRNPVAEAKSALKTTVKKAKTKAKKVVLVPLVACGEYKENAKAKADEGNVVVARRPYISAPYNVTIRRNDVYGGVVEHTKGSGMVADGVN